MLDFADEKSNCFLLNEVCARMTMDGRNGSLRRQMFKFKHFFHMFNIWIISDEFQMYSELISCEVWL